MLSVCELRWRLAAGATAAPCWAQLANFAQALRFARRTHFSVLLLSHGPILCTAVWPTLLPSWSVWRNAVWPAMLTRDVAHAFNLANKQDLGHFD